MLINSSRDLRPQSGLSAMSTVFVSVGTTSFDPLVTEVNKPEFHAALWKLGYRNLIVQHGNGAVSPSLPSKDSIDELKRSYPQFFDSCCDLFPLHLTAFQYKTDLDAEFSSAALVISHGGAGTCLRALTPSGSRRLIVVINDTLMGNHQEELALALSEGKHALVTTVHKLNDLLRQDRAGLRFPFKSSSNLSDLLAPNIPPTEAGFVGFERGRPEHLLDYLNARLSA